MLTSQKRNFDGATLLWISSSRTNFGHSLSSKLVALVSPPPTTPPPHQVSSRCPLPPPQKNAPPLHPINASLPPPPPLLLASPSLLPHPSPPLTLQVPWSRYRSPQDSVLQGSRNPHNNPPPLLPRPPPLRRSSPLPPSLLPSSLSPGDDRPLPLVPRRVRDVH